ncbi:MAG: hypothetical protein ACLTBU_15925 [Zhenhengia sp.]
MIIISKASIEKRLERLLVQIERNDRRIVKIKKMKRKIFRSATKREQELIMKYEELESEERGIVVEAIYLNAVKGMT